MVGDNQDDAIPFDEQEERLPWLEPVADVYEEEPVSSGRLAALVVGGLVAIGLVVGGLWWWQQSGGRARGDVIAAPDGDYKLPADPEKGRFDDEGNVAVAAAEGAEPNGRVDPARLPEQPVTVAPAAPRPAANATPARPATANSARPAAAAATAAAAPAAASAASGGSAIQLGAFASQATANRAFDSLKGRFSWLSNATPTVTAAEVGGRTVYRLRTNAGSAATARDWCGRLRVAGENCIVLP